MDRAIEIPSIEALEQELQRARKQKRRGSIVRGLLCAFVTLLAGLVLAAALWLPILQVYGVSMEPAYQKDEVLVAAATGDYGCGDVIAFYHNNTIQVRRIIAGPGSWIIIDAFGNVWVDGDLLIEPYVQSKALGQCDLELPYQVPDGYWFVMGDNRAESVDSRSSVVGCVSEDRIIGRIVFRVWPLERFGKTE